MTTSGTGSGNSGGTGGARRTTTGARKAEGLDRQNGRSGHNGGDMLHALRGEAAALQARAEYLTRSTATLEAQITKLVSVSGGRRTPQIGRVRDVTRETLAVLEQTVRRRAEVRRRITELEAPNMTAPPARPVAPVRERTDPRPEPAMASERPLTGPSVTPAVPSPPLPPVALTPASSPPTSVMPMAGPPVVDLPTSHIPTISLPFPAPQVPAPVIPVPAPVDEPRIQRQQLARLSSRGRAAPVLVGRVVRTLLAAVLGSGVIALALLLTPLPELFGYQLYAVLSGSMEPAIAVGSVMALKPISGADLRVGDVITFSDRTRPDLRVTHRVVELQTKNDQRVAIPERAGKAMRITQRTPGTCRRAARLGASGSMCRTPAKSWAG